MTAPSARPEPGSADDPQAGPARPADPPEAASPALGSPPPAAAPLPRLRLPGVSGAGDDASDDAAPGKARRRGAGDPNLRAKDRRGNASRDQRKFVPRRGGG